MAGPAVSAGARRPVVLESVKPPRPSTNPYVVQLVSGLREHLDVLWFDWRTALLGRYDVLHVHWPEVLLRREGRPQRWAALARFALLLLRLRGQRGIVVVRTRHNLAQHESGGRLETRLLAALERRTAHTVALNEQTPAGPGEAVTVIPHGDYRAWFARFPQPEPAPGRILYFGLIRPYKGVEHLIGTFRALPGGASSGPLSLHVVGRPGDDAQRRAVLAAAAADPRIETVLEYVDDARLAAEVGRAELVVLPYREMHNSGALLLALSLHRPVLVPETRATLALAAEVGPGWVRTYRGDLTPAALADALARARSVPGGPAPDLRRRSWPQIAARHVELFRGLAGRAGPASSSPDPALRSAP